MVWARFDDEILDNEKIIRAGAAGFALHTAAVTWCCRNLTDGLIPRAKVRALLDLDDFGIDAMEVATRLCDEGLWERELEGDELVAFRIHDFLVYNPSRDDVLAERARLSGLRSEAGRAGGQRSGEARRGKQTRSKPEANDEANPKQTVSPVPDPVPVPINPSETRAREEQEPDPEELGPAAPADVVDRDSKPENIPAGELIPMKPPEWFAEVVDAVRTSTGEDIDHRVAWSRYSGHRARAGKPMGPMDARYFVTTVDVVEAKRTRQLARERQDRLDEAEHRQAARSRRGMSPPVVRDRPQPRPELTPDEVAARQRELDAEVARALGTGS